MARGRRAHISRYREIGSVIAKYGFSELVEEVGLGRVFPRLPRGPVTAAEKVELRARNLRLALQDLGPTFIKAGQVLSSRPDLLPAVYIAELEKLQDKVVEFDYETAKKTVEDELGRPLDELFSHFSEAPIASASLSQVHKATLKTGEQVAVKIRRPGIEKMIEQDIRIFHDIAYILQRSQAVGKYYDFVGTVDGFERIIHEELEFRLEASNIERVKKSLRLFKHITLPEVYLDYSTQKVLTLEFIDGIHITAIDELESDEIDKKVIASELFRAYIKQIIEDGFFHADPHPGNILVTREGMVYLIDLGMVGRLDGNLQSQIARILIDLVDQNSDGVTETVMYLGVRSEDTNFDQLSRDIGNLTTRYYGRAIEAIGLSDVLNGLVAVITRNHIKVPSNFALLAKTVVLVDGIVRRLDPDFNYSEALRTSITRIVLTRLRAQFSAVKLFGATLESSDFLVSLPRHLGLLTDKLVKDDFRIKFEHHRLESLEKTISHSANLLTVALIVSAIVLGSGLVISADVGPKVFGFPALGLLGFILASILGLYLVYQILRSRR
ncbi:MAG: AarF/ABC1/UbiB kinase family protein [Candidatus Aquicultor sp.]|nr:AarF/ABC1/UbiB kinase family protein [Candidatus Aquicultor sp.]